MHAPPSVYNNKVSVIGDTRGSQFCKSVTTICLSEFMTGKLLHATVLTFLHLNIQVLLLKKCLRVSLILLLLHHPQSSSFHAEVTSEAMLTMNSVLV